MTISRPFYIQSDGKEEQNWKTSLQPLVARFSVKKDKNTTESYSLRTPCMCTWKTKTNEKEEETWEEENNFSTSSYINNQSLKHQKSIEKKLAACTFCPRFSSFLSQLKKVRDKKTWEKFLLFLIISDQMFLHKKEKREKWFCLLLFFSWEGMTWWWYLDTLSDEVYWRKETFYILLIFIAHHNHTIHSHHQTLYVISSIHND